MSKTASTVNLNLNDHFGGLKITDVSGRIVVNVEETNQFQLQINTRKLKAGAYFLEVVNGSRIKKMKLIKK